MVSPEKCKKEEIFFFKQKLWPNKVYLFCALKEVEKFMESESKLQLYILLQFKHQKLLIICFSFWNVYHRLLRFSKMFFLIILQKSYFLSLLGQQNPKDSPMKKCKNHHHGGNHLSNIWSTPFTLFCEWGKIIFLSSFFCHDLLAAFFSNPTVCLLVGWFAKQKKKQSGIPCNYSK